VSRSETAGGRGCGDGCVCRRGAQIDHNEALQTAQFPALASIKGYLYVRRPLPPPMPSAPDDAAALPRRPFAAGTPTAYRHAPSVRCLPA
jgi:hypothetical protein